MAIDTIWSWRGSWTEISAVYGRPGIREAGYDNERGKGDQRHFQGAETTYAFTLDDLNVHHFPFRYRDMERLATFQNRVFAKYASRRGLSFIDVASAMPFDPDLFADAIHNTYPGIRMQAWVALQQLVPIVEKRLASGAWPKPVPAMSDTHPAFTVEPRQITFECESP